MAAKPKHLGPSTGQTESNTSYSIRMQLQELSLEKANSRMPAVQIPEQFFPGLGMKGGSAGLEVASVGGLQELESNLQHFNI